MFLPFNVFVALVIYLENEFSHVLIVEKKLSIHPVENNDREISNYAFGNYK